MEISRITLDRRQTIKLMGSACVMQALWACQGGSTIDAENVTPMANNKDPQPFPMMENNTMPSGMEAGTMPAGMETGGMLSGVEAGVDAGVEAGVNAGVEAGDMPSGVEAGDMPSGMEAGVDAGIEAGVEAGDMPNLDMVIFDLSEADYEELNNIGGTASVDTPNEKIILIRINQDSILALNRICTHSSCDMKVGLSGQWDQDAQQLICTCHNSIFDTTGQVVSGPANRPLDVYTVTFDQNTGVGNVDL